VEVACITVDANPFQVRACLWFESLFLDSVYSIVCDWK